MKRLCSNNSRIGFARSICGISEFLESFVCFNDLENVKLHLRCRRRKWHPGPDRINSFMKQTNLSLQEATKLNVARYNAIKNPFLI